MRVGMDAGALSVTDDRLRVGVYRVSHELVKELPRISVKDNYRFYTFGRGGDTLRGTLRNNAEIVRLPQAGFHSVWQTIDVRKSPVDVYLGLAQTIPPFMDILCDVRKVGVIYDTGFLDYPELYPGSAGSLLRRTAALVAVSDRIITISKASRAAIRKAYNVAEEKISVSYPGVSDVFRASGNVYKHKRPYIMYAGALKRSKNIPVMLRAFAEFLTTQKQPYDFILAGGDYWPDPAIPVAIRELGLEDRVVMTGFLPDSMLAEYYRGARVFVSASLVEGFGLPAAEAMASGTPVVVSDRGAYREIVGETGILADPQDFRAIASAILRLAKDGAFRNNCIEKAVKRASAFRWKRFAEGVHDTIRSAGGSKE